MFKTFSRSLLGAGLIGLALTAHDARAGTILVFGQQGVTNTTSATNPTTSTTTITNTNTPITITAIDGSSGVSTPVSAFFNLSATSTGAATIDGSGDITQHYSGGFSITSASGGGGTNYLSGTFTDALFGSGTGLTLTAAQPSGTETVSFTSSVLSISGLPRSLSIAFTSVTPPATTTGSPATLAAFTASVAGNFSAPLVPEPGTVAMAFSALPVLGLFWVRRRLAA